MPLILAIEPDRRQASHLTAMVRGRLRAEFVIGDSAEHALAALGDRVPDLVLTTALLSPKDESALAERLRALDGAAAHVQTLTIPVLATPGAQGRRAQKAAGVLSALLGDKSGDDAVADGCDPAVFAEQCKEYLERAAAERATVVEQADQFAAEAADEQQVDMPEPVTVTYTPEPAPPVRSLFSTDEEPPQSLMDVVAALAEEEPEPVAVAAAPITVAAEPADTGDAVNDVEDEAADDGLLHVDLSEMLDDPAQAAARRAQAEEEAARSEVFELDSSLLEESSVSEVALYAPLARPEVRTWPILEGLTTGAPAAEQSTATAAEVPAKTAASDEPVEWTDIIEALRRDAQPVAIVRSRTDDSTEIARASEPTPASSEADALDVTDDGHLNGSGSVYRGAPVQDEWGFFDPDRAGFAALLAKLEEITEQDADGTPQRT